MSISSDFLSAKFEGLVTLTLDQVTWHTTVHRSSTSTTSSFIRIRTTCCIQTDVGLQTGGQTDTETGFIRPTLSQVNNKRRWSHTSASVWSQPSESLQTTSCDDCFIIFFMKRSRCFWFMHEDACTCVSTWQSKQYIYHYSRWPLSRHSEIPWDFPHNVRHSCPC